MDVSVLTCERVTKRFPAVTAVADVTLQVGRGEVVGFLGPNGAGKTTTMRMLIGALRPSSGRCSVLGGSLRNDVRLRGKVGYLPGDLRMDPTMTGAQLFSWFGRLRGGTDPKRVDELVQRLDLDPSRRFGTLSKGNRQKVGIIQALLHRPEAIILDEPTTGLDPLVQREFLALLRESAASGAGVLFSSHVLPEVERIADRVAIIRGGRLVTESTVDELLDRTRRHLELRFAESVPERLFDGVAGVVSVETDGRTATVAIDGPVGPAMAAATRAGTLLRVNAAGDDLEDLFYSLYEGSTRPEEAR